MKVIDEVLSTIKDKAELVVVSKYQPIEKIEEYYEMGIRDFGENKVQELLTKVNMHDDINWHFIGRLQTNKVKDVVKHCHLLHSLNRFELIDAIQKEAKKQDRIMPCLIQFNIAKEETKSGFEVSEANEVMNYLKNCPNIMIKGIMCMGPHVEDEDCIRKVFKEAKILFDSLKDNNQANWEMKYLSMGMSRDFKIAVEEGSTLVRIGRDLF